MLDSISGRCSCDHIGVQTSTAKPLTIAMIGTGTMGSPIGLNMIAAGHRVVAYDRFAEATSDLAAAGSAIAGSVAEARAHGKMRMEGKDYVMQDGDVVEFRFNV